MTILRRKGSRKSRRKLVLVLVILLVVLLLVGSVRVLGSGSLLRVRQISCHNDQYGLCDQLRASLLDQTFSSQDTQTAIEKVKRSQYHVKEINFKKDWRYNLEFTFDYRLPFATLVAKEGNYLIDEEGIPFEAVAASASATPIVSSLKEPPTLGVKILSSGIISSVEILKAFQANGLSLASIEDRRDYLCVYMPSETQIWFPNKENLGSKSYLELGQDIKRILERALVDGKKFNKIDMRFSKITVE